MEKHVRSKSLKGRSNCKSECGSEGPNIDLNVRRLSTGSPFNRKGIFGHKTLGHNLGRVHEDDTDQVFSKYKIKESPGPRFKTALHHRG